MIKNMKKIKRRKRGIYHALEDIEKGPETQKVDERDFACIYHTCVHVRIVGHK